MHFYDDHARELSGLADGDLRAAWSKLEGYAARLALEIQLVRVVASGAGGREIDEVSMKAGIELARWFGHEARRVYAVLDETEDERERHRLLRASEGGSVSVSSVRNARHERSFAVDEQDWFAIEKDIGGFAKNATSTIRGRLTVVHGTPCGDIRCFVVSATGELVATRQGICLARAKLPELAQLVEAMVSAAADFVGDGESEAAVGEGGEGEAVRQATCGDGER